MPNKIIATPYLTVNNENIAIVPNSLSFTEGKGEQTVKSASVGGGGIKIVYSDNADNKISMVKFQLYSTSENLDRVRVWKSNTNENAASVSDNEGFSRTFTQMAITNDPEANLQSEGVIDVEFHGAPAV